MYTEQDKGYIWLSLTPKMTPQRRQKILNYTDDLVALMADFEAAKEDITDLVGEETYSNLLITLLSHAIDKELASLEAMGAVAITLGSDDYPDCLREIAQPPLVLYCKGDTSLLYAKNLAVVGTRGITRYGRDVTQNFVADIATNGFCIVSGLARGVDTVAHRTALQYERPTIGVLPCGLDKVYPAENKDLFEQIAANGLLVSEYPLGTTVQQYTFVERNRIISGLSIGVLVTEAGEYSGASITVSHALEQSRDVFVVPGNIYSKASIGTNNLLKTLQGALVTNAIDILEYYHLAVDKGPVCSIQLDIIETQIISALEEGDKHIEELLALTDTTVSTLTPILTKLELMGMLKKLNGNYFGI